MKAVWKGSISFGLVNIPVKLYNAGLSREIQFRLLHKKDGGRIRFRKVCEKCGEDVSREDTVRAFEISKNEYVILTEEDFKSLPLKSTRTIEIQQFFDPSELDIIHYEHFYYASPDRGGEKSFALLTRAMERAGSMGIGKMTMRGKERLMTLRPYHGGIVVCQIRYLDEIKPIAEVPGWNPEVDVSDEEIGLAVQLINAMKKPLRLEDYTDNYRMALSRLIEAKLSGKEIQAPAPPSQHTESLMDALRASLESVGDL